MNDSGLSATIVEPAATGSNRSLANHIAGFDWLRMLAAYGVIWIHCFDMHPSARYVAGLFGFAVPAFVTMAFLLFVRSASSKENASATSIIWKRCRRIVPAYLAWSAIYVAARIAKRALLHTTGPEFDWTAVLLTGGASYHLYFLPAMILWTAAAAPWRAALLSTTRPALLGATLILAGIGFVVAEQNWARPYDMVFLSHLRGLTPYVFFGLGMGLVLPHGLREATRWIPPVVGLAVAMALIALSNNWPHSTAVATSTVSNLLIVWSFFSMPTGWTGATARRLAECAFGIYLCHAIFVEGGQVALLRVGMNHPSLTIVVAFTLAVMAASLSTTLILNHSRATRWLVV